MSHWVSQKQRGCPGRVRHKRRSSSRNQLRSSSAAGAPVTRVVILQGESKDLPFLICQGFDWLADYNGIENVGTSDMGASFLEQSGAGAGGLLPGSPTCAFCGKQIPCCAAATPHGGIDGGTLTDALRVMDELKALERRDGLCLLALLGRHQARFAQNFLQHINDPAHKWVVAIGAPCGTHIWQVGDSLEQSGMLKMSFNKLLGARSCKGSQK